MNTAGRQRVLNKLGHACFGRIKQAFDSWKGDTFRKFAMEVERKKAKCIDELIRQNMSPIQQSFLKWAKQMRDEVKRAYGDQIKAGFALTSLYTRFMKANREKY